MRKVDYRTDGKRYWVFIQNKCCLVCVGKTYHYIHRPDWPLSVVYKLLRNYLIGIAVKKVNGDILVKDGRNIWQVVDKSLTLKVRW